MQQFILYSDRKTFSHLFLRGHCFNCCSYILLIGGFVNKHFEDYIPALFRKNKKRHRKNYYLDE